MSDQTGPRVWNAGDPEPPADVTAVQSQLNSVVFRRGANSVWSLWYATRESGGDGHGYRWYQLAGADEGDNAAPLTEVQTSSPVSVPAEDGNASERPNGGQHGDQWMTTRATAHKLQARIDAALAVCDAGEHQATRWEQPFPVPAWVTDVRAALSAAPVAKETDEGAK